MNIFAALPAGDSATWSDDPVQLPDGRVADATAWTLKYYLRGPSALDITAVASGAKWQSTLGTTASAALAAGLYAWTAIITGGSSERITVGSGQCTLTANVALASVPYDTRSTAQIALDSCEAAMATFNSTGGKVKKYEIAGRTMEFQTIGELMALHSFWKAKFLSEQSASSIAQGLGNPRNLFIRHVRPN